MTFDPRSLGARCDECPLNECTPVPPQTAKYNKPRLIIIGESPGRLEAQKGIPFIGPAGRMLDGLLTEAKFDRALAHVSNTVMCRPDEDNDLKRAVPCCAPRLANELAAFDAAIPILALGAAASKVLIGKAGIMKARGFVWKAPLIRDQQIRSAERAVEKLLESVGRWSNGKPKKPDAKTAAKILKAKDTAALTKARRLIQGRTVFPAVHPAFILRGADGWLPTLRIDVRRAVRWSIKPFPLEDEGPFTATKDPKQIARVLRRMSTTVVVDIETIGNDPMRIPMTCVGICDVEDTSKVLVVDPWIPRRHVKVLREALKNRHVVAHNGPQFDEIVLGRDRIRYPKRDDTMIAHFSFCSHLPKALAHVVSIYCDAAPWKTLFKQGNEEKGVAGFNVKKEDLAVYNAADVRLSALSWRRMQADLAPERKVYELDMQMAGLYQRMQVTGILVDEKRRRELSRKLKFRSAALIGEMRQLLGRRNFHPAKLLDIRKALFGQLKAPTWLAPPTPTGLPAVNAHVLEALKTGDNRAARLADLIIRWRSANDVRAEYLDNLNPHTDGRVHAGWRLGVECLATGQLVLTNRGYLAVEDVRVGDSAISHEGRPQKIVGTSIHRPTPIYRVSLSNGLVLRTNAAHPYRIGGKWKRADKLHIGDRAAVHSDAEVWAPIGDWPYEVSSWGRIRREGRILRQQPKGRWGHLKVALKRNNARRRCADFHDFPIHRLVLTAHGPKGEGEARHMNGIAWDNTVRNLAWGTSKENKQDAIRHGTMSHRYPGHKQVKLTQNDADYIRKNPLGQSDQTLADGLGVSRELVRDIRLGKAWRPMDVVGVRAVFYEAAVVAVNVEPPEVTYGLTVDQDASHVTGGVVTHNTGRPSTRKPNLLNAPRMAYCSDLIVDGKKTPGCGAMLIDGMEHREGCRRKQEPQPEEQVRDVYVAPPGSVLLYFDESQAEMRMASNLSGDENFIAACKADVHAGNAMVIFADTPGAKEMLTLDPKGKGKKFRDIAKNCGFAIVYLAEAEKLYVHLLEHGFDVSMQICQDIIDRIHSSYSRYFRYVDENIALCRKQGFLRTAFLGRKRWMGYYPKPTTISNFPIQGGVADITNERLLLIDARKPKKVKQLIYQYDSAVYEVTLADVERMKKVIEDVWAEPIKVPHNGREFLQPIEMKVGRRLSDFG